MIKPALSPKYRESTLVMQVEMGILLQQQLLLQLRPAGMAEALLRLLQQRLRHRKVATAALSHSIYQGWGMIPSAGVAVQSVLLAHPFPV